MYFELDIGNYTGDSLLWEYSTNGNNWVKIEGAIHDLISIDLTMTGYYWAKVYYRICEPFYLH